MIIGVDIRSLMDKNYSGVSIYAFNLLNAFFKIDKDNEYRLFYNSFFKDRADRTYWTNNENVRLCGSRIPNKIFNASATFLNFPKIDKLLEKSPLSPLCERGEQTPPLCERGEQTPPLCERGEQTPPLCERGEQKVDIFFSPNFLFTALSENCKKIVTVHDLSFERCPRFYNLKGRLWHKFVRARKMCENADLIIAVSENTKYDIMELYGISEEKIRVVYSGVDQNRTDKSDKTDRTDKSDRTDNLSNKYILFLGNVEKRKNVLGVIEAFKILNETYGICDYDLVIAGNQKLRNEEIKKLGKSVPKIKFTGYIDEKYKSELYKNASLFVYPSFYEGFGFPPLEAMSCGCPVVTSNCSSLPEIIGDSAIMADPYNAEDIAGAMAKILTDDKLCSLMVQRGFERVKKFSWEKCAREMLSVFYELARN